MQYFSPLFGNRYIGPYLRWLASSTLMAGGPIPQHVAFIMDGNRRYARARKQEILKGHDLGGNILKETIEWCNELGISTVSAFAFSIENFKRPKEEVDQLMNLAREKLVKYIPELASKVRIRFLGDMSLLPDDLRRSIVDAIERSKNIPKYTLNICFGYTSTDEMSRASTTLLEAVRNQILTPNDITPALFSSCLDTRDSPPPDIIVRTSGEIRLSDFMLWQSSYSCIIFCDVLWPEFSAIDLYQIILKYQRNYSTYLQMQKFSYIADKPDEQQSGQEERIQRFWVWKEERDLALLRNLTNPQEKEKQSTH